MRRHEGTAHAPAERMVEAQDRRHGRSRGILAALAAHDVVILGYLLAFAALILRSEHPGRFVAGKLVLADLAWFVVALALDRAPHRYRRLAQAFYRLTLVGILVGSYVQLRWILPVVSGPTVDAELMALDLRLFRVEPALVLDRFVSPSTTEWFSLFYYSYFYLLAAYVLPITFVVDDERILHDFAFGLIALVCITHVCYALVPAYGPYVYWPDFANRLGGDRWWPLVKEVVHAAGAPTDVFPSLHTGAPSLLAIFAFRHRRHRVFRWTWIPTAFIASQIVVSTMFLRWHYLIDVVAGLLLAGGLSAAAPVVARWEARRRTLGGPPLFAPLRDVTRGAT